MLEQLLDAPPATLFQNPTEVAEGGPMPRAQDRPLGEMQWENFERLCLRPVRRKGTIRSNPRFARRLRRKVIPSATRRSVRHAVVRGVIPGGRIHERVR